MRSIPRLDAASCARARVRGSSCAECALVCPAGALMPTRDGVAVDHELCTGCAQCQGACPSGSLGRVATPPVMQGRVVLRCSRVEGATVSCVHALGLEDLSRLVLDGARELVTTTGACATCVDCPDAPLSARVAVIAQWQSQRGLRPLRLRDAPRDPPTEQPDLRRRGLFRTIAQSAADAPEAPAMARLQQDGQGAVALYAVRIDSTRCTGCHACVRVCDTGAMILVKDQTGQLVYRNEAQACTGCRLCEDVCDDDAISLRPLAGPQEPLPLRSFRCRVCGVDSARPEGQGTDDLCRVCQKAPHARDLFHVMEP